MDEQSLASSSVGLPPKKAALGLTTEQYTFTPGEGSPGGASSVTGGASLAPPKRKTLMEQQSEVKGDAFLQKEELQQDADPKVVTHKKVAGNGYEKGPTYNPNDPDEPLTASTAAPGVLLG